MALRAAMKKLIPFVLLITSCSQTPDRPKAAAPNMAPAVTHAVLKDLSDPTNPLTGKTETLELTYVAWGCACANWVTLADLEKDGGVVAAHCLYLEPASKDLELPADFDANLYCVKVVGQFYAREGWPKETFESEEPIEKGRVFRYTRITWRKR